MNKKKKRTAAEGNFPGRAWSLHCELEDSHPQGMSSQDSCILKVMTGHA